MLCSSPLYSRPLPQHYKHSHLFVIWCQDKLNKCHRRLSLSFRQGHLVYLRSVITKLYASFRNRSDTCLPGEIVKSVAASKTGRRRRSIQQWHAWEWGFSTIGSVQIQSAHTKRSCLYNAWMDWLIDWCCLFLYEVSITLLAPSTRGQKTAVSALVRQRVGVAVSSTRPDVRQECSSPALCYHLPWSLSISLFVSFLHKDKQHYSQ